MGKYEDLAKALGKAGVKGTDESLLAIAKGVKDPDALLKSIARSGAVFDSKIMKEIAGLSTDSVKTLARLQTQSNIVLTRAIRSIQAAGGDISPILTKKGKLIKGDFTPEEVAKMFRKSTDDIAKMADDVDVKKAATSRKSDLIKLGISGSMVMGVVFLMLLTGKTNPVEAIAEALKAAAETAAETGGDIFQKLLTGGIGGLFNVSAMFLFSSSIALVLWLVISVVLKK